MSEKTINCLCVVDTAATVNGTTTVYMLDDNGDPNQGSNELTINCDIGDTINFNVASIIPTWGCVLTAFVPATSPALFVPNYVNGVWTGIVNSKGNMTYHFNFTVNGQPGTYNWDPFINVT
ncbi:MAG: hypothetical protein JWM27_781 [Gemmatimonadetes bacterium]|jgi:hypothetical protein|nr:hypothetical protein [Gemmatimonadota bacterium]